MLAQSLWSSNAGGEATAGPLLEIGRTSRQSSCVCVRSTRQLQVAFWGGTADQLLEIVTARYSL
jgi:hypothetical protein